MCEAILGHLAWFNWLSRGQLFLCPFPSALGVFCSRNIRVLSHPLGSSISLDRSTLLTQFCLTPTQNVTVAVFSLTYKYFSTVFQVLTRNMSQKYFPYQFLDSIFHLLGLCSPFSITFEFYISHLTKSEVSSCICWFWNSSTHHKPLTSLLPISTFHFQSLTTKEKKKEKKIILWKQWLVPWLKAKA